MSIRPVFVAGATGYIGGRLVPRLLEKGCRVRVFGRSLEKLRSRPWGRHPSVEFAQGDVLDLSSLRRGLRGCGKVYYLVHSMVAGEKDFSVADRLAAQNMVAASREACVEGIIYLGGLGETGGNLSKHLASRAEVAEILRSGGIPVCVLRAAMVIGSGSASFEILRYLVERLPVMVTPRWVQTECQPIAISNVIGYLEGCFDHPETANGTFDIGGADIVTYKKLMEIYAEEACLPKRIVFGVPVLTPRLSSYWIHLVTPVPAVIARPLAEGLRHRVVCRDNRIREIIPQKLLTCRDAIAKALDSQAHGRVPSCWTDAGKIPPVEAALEGDPSWAGGTVKKDVRIIKVRASQEAVWSLLERIGGRTGWYHADLLWAFRGFLDRMCGGVGLRRGRRHPSQILPGDALDFWRVICVRPPHSLALTAEMKLPGRAYLEFRVWQNDADFSELTQIATFYPRGLFGLLYWWILSPLHRYVFGGMIQKIARLAEEKDKHENNDRLVQTRP